MIEYTWDENDGVRRKVDVTAVATVETVSVVVLVGVVLVGVVLVVVIVFVGIVTDQSDLTVAVTQLYPSRLIDCCCSMLSKQNFVLYSQSKINATYFRRLC